MYNQITCLLKNTQRNWVSIYRIVSQSLKVASLKQEDSILYGMNEAENIKNGLLDIDQQVLLDSTSM